MRKQYTFEHLVNSQFSILGNIEKTPFESRVKTIASITASLTEKILREFEERALGLLECMDVSMQAAFFNRYLRNEAKVYVIAEEFGKQLNRANLAISCKHLPPVGWIGFLEFPEKLVFKNGKDYHRGTILGMGVDPQGIRTVQIVLPDFDSSGEITATKTVGVVPIEDGKTIEECINAVKAGRSIINESPAYKKLLEKDEHLGFQNLPLEPVEFAIKAVTYIESSKPDIESEWKLCLTKNPKKIRRHFERFAPFPIEKVGFGFHGKTCHVISTNVSGHFRWQRFGPGLDSVKLVWIDEHERSFQNNANPPSSSCN
jgi:hypothetical protein